MKIFKVPKKHSHPHTSQNYNTHGSFALGSHSIVTMNPSTTTSANTARISESTSIPKHKFKNLRLWLFVVGFICVIRQFTSPLVFLPTSSRTITAVTAKKVTDTNRSKWDQPTNANGYYFPESLYALDEQQDKAIQKSSSHQKKRVAFPTKTSSTAPIASLAPNNTNASSSTCVSPLPLSWEWNYFSRNSNATAAVKQSSSLLSSSPAKKRLLIGLYCGYDKYAGMLEVTAPVNKAYARQWNHDLVVLQGTHLIVESVDGDCNPPGRRAAFNKIALLQYALKHSEKYDQLLILDTDAMMYDMSVDVTTLLPDDHMLTAHRVRLVDNVHTTDINNGVTLWNLHHPLTKKVQKSWERNSILSIETDASKDNDQKELHRALKADERFVTNIYSSRDEFAYGHGTVIRHYIRRRGQKGWEDPNILENRLDRLEQAAKEVCQDKHPFICAGIELTVYTNY
jgi:hypothetical protein